MRKEFRMKLSSTFGAIRPGSKPDNWRRIEGRQWWLSLTGVLVSLLLTLGIVSFVLPAFIPGLGEYSIDTSPGINAGSTNDTIPNVNRRETRTPVKDNHH